jgi:hypothetical protein
MRTAILGLSLAATAVIAASAPAEAGARDLGDARPMELRVGAAGYLGNRLLGPTNGFGGVTVARQLGGALAGELTAGHGFANEHGTGLQLGAALRARLALDARGRHAVTCAIGGLRAQGSDYGGVGFALGEVAYALRLPAGFVLLAGGGIGVVLNDSETPLVADCGYLCPSPLPSPFRSGAVGPWARLEAGWSF